MPIIIQKYHAYNKVFFLDLNKLAFYPPFYLDPYGARCFSKSWAVARQNGFTELLVIHSLIDFLSEGFKSFVK